MSASTSDKEMSLTRRSLLRLLGGGILVAAVAPDAIAAAFAKQRGASVPQVISAWIHVGADGRVTVFTGKVDVGQNARTSVAQAAAEELRVPMSRISVIMGDTDLVPFDMGTFGSRTSPTMIPQVRRAAAAARERLLELASKQLGASPASLTAAEGKVLAPDGKSIGYGKLAAAEKFDEPITGDVALTPTADWKVLGTSQPKMGARDIVTGVHRYASDMVRPGMLFAKVLRPPKLGSTLKSVDVSDAEKMPGARVVHEGDFVAVAAPTLRQAVAAVSAIRAEWDHKPQPSREEFFSAMAAEASARHDSVQGDHVLRAQYVANFIAHVPLEPRAALAEWDGKKLTVYTGTQRPFAVKYEVAQALGVSQNQVRVIVPDTGGGFGGKHTGEAAVEAARIAKALGRPVRLTWSREEEFTFAYFRPGGVVQAASATSNDGKLLAWEFDNYNSGPQEIEPPYDIPSHRAEFHDLDSPLRKGSYRGLAATFNTFARESHIDEIAHSLNIDPLEFRKRNLSNPRLLAVLQAAADKFGWADRKAAPGTGFGIACATEKGSFIATAVEVRVDPSTQAVTVPRAVSAFECGAILNPELLRNQVSGAAIMGIGAALFEAIDFADDKIITDRLSKYRVPRYTDVPALDVVLLDRKDLPSDGAGETPIIAIAPAIGNAIFDATGERPRTLPMGVGKRH